ncbi:hypothetical protein AB0I06_10745 [Streptomyces sp. NPDC050674]|uniref:hypothetical protein n=1 Tax=Streptomyces sp. NPDC050674 TaxID=3157216 RepID=UPI00343FBFB3
MTTNTPARPREGTWAAMPPTRREPPAPHAPAPAETGPFAPRARGRHRKPRPRKVLLAAGGLALATGALSLLRLTSGPGTDTGPVEAGARPDPVTSATDDTTHTAATFPALPQAGPSSPTTLGGPAPSRGGTEGARPSPAAATGTPVTSAATGPAPTTIPDTPNTADRAPAPRASGGGTPRPAPPAPPTGTTPPSRATPAPAPRPDEPEQPHDPGLCVPVVGVCVDSPLGR